ncbi:MAG TPA: ATP-binding protein, partial [Micromonosporaceae bacterium]|nr:ATP-binding protein [Micromonosporaceae bacterium]
GRLALPVILASYATAIYEGFARSAWLTGGLSVLIAVAAGDVFMRTSGPARKAGGPALVAALTFAGVLALSSANVLLHREADLEVALGYDIAVCAVVVWLTADLRYGRWTEATIADLVTQLGGRTGTSGLQAELRRTLGDPTLTIGYWDPRLDAYIDETGSNVDLRGSAARVTTAIEDDGQPVAVLVHDATALEDLKLIAGATAALRLAVTNARLRSEVRARVADLAAARRRIVEAADAQRLAIEAELATGAERHLSEVAHQLAVLEEAADEQLQSELRPILADVEAGRRELREFAQGIRPQSLTAGGLSAALSQLASRAGLPVTVDVSVGRLPPAVESALYFVSSEALTNAIKHTEATAVIVRVFVEGGNVIAHVSDDGRGGADPNGSGLRGIADRVEALGGSFTVGDDAAGGTRLVATMPLKGGPT